MTKAIIDHTDTFATVPEPEASPASAQRMQLNMGPQHPSTHGVLRIVLELEGEIIKSAEPDIGFLHTGIEKEFEQKHYQQGVTLTDRVDYLANLSNNLVYALTVEKLLQIEIPPRAQWMLLRQIVRIGGVRSVQKRVTPHHDLVDFRAPTSVEHVHRSDALELVCKGRRMRRRVQKSQMNDYVHCLR